MNSTTKLDIVRELLESNISTMEHHMADADRIGAWNGYESREHAEKLRDFLNEVLK